MATLSSKVTPAGVASAAQGTLADSAVQPNDSPTFDEVSLNKLNDANGDEALTITSDSTVQVHNEIEFIGNTGLNAHIQKSAESGRDELQIYAATDANGAGSRGAGMHLYGNSDNEHAGNVAFITGPNDGGEGRMFVSGWDTNTHVTIGNGPTGQTIWQFVDNENDKALLNLINPTGGPALFFMEANGSTEGDITVNDGETLQFGHWNYTTSTYTNRMAMTPTGFDVLGGITAGGDVTVDTTTLHVDSTNHRVGIGTITPTNQLNIEDTADVKVVIKSTGTGDADATLVLGSADTGESVLQFEHDGVYGAKLEWFTDGAPDLNITTVGATSVIDMQPNGVRTGRFDTSGLEVTGTVTATSYAGDGSALTGVLSKGADIGGSVDLNTYTTDGYYHQNSNSSATSGTNYPANLAGMLTVMADGNMVYQKYQTYNGSGAYQRTKYNSTWYAWDKILDSGNLTTTGTITATSFAGDGSNLTGISAAVKGFITFNGSTGAVINSSNLTLSKTATGSYTIALASGIQIGSADYTVIIGNVDDKRTFAAQQTAASNNDKVSNYNAWVNTRTNTNFTVSATRTNHGNLHFGGNDNNSGTAFGLALVDPVEISIAVLD
jgi:hypothetical protein